MSIASEIARGDSNTAKIPAFAVAQLLIELFSVKDFELFLIQYYPELLPFLAPDAPSYYFNNVALCMHRHGLVDGRLRTNLVQSRPNQIELINDVFKGLDRSEGVLSLTFEGKLEDLTPEMLSAMVSFLRAKMQNESTVILAIRAGSVIIEVGLRVPSQALARVESSTQALAPRSSSSELVTFWQNWQDRRDELRRELLAHSGMKLIRVTPPSEPRKPKTTEIPERQPREESVAAPEPKISQTTRAPEIDVNNTTLNLLIFTAAAVFIAFVVAIFLG